MGKLFTIKICGNCGYAHELWVKGNDPLDDGEPEYLNFLCTNWKSNKCVEFVKYHSRCKSWQRKRPKLQIKNSLESEKQSD
ncbi:MAG: hypothetical protein FWG65_03800 [Turicibacter sp.]|nr:hypothetical protein [Turicibacter sp.]